MTVFQEMVVESILRNQSNDLVSFFSEDNVLSDEIKICNIFLNIKETKIKCSTLLGTPGILKKNGTYQVRVCATIDGHKLLGLYLVEPNHPSTDDGEAPMSEAVDDVHIALAMTLDAEKLQRRGQQDAVGLAKCTVGRQDEVSRAGTNS